MGNKHSLLMKFDQFISCRKRKKISKFFAKTLLCLQRIKHNHYWKMKFLKQATYIRYVIAKLPKFAQSSIQTSSDSLLRRILWSFILKYIAWTGQISLSDCVYLPSYLVKCVSWFMLWYLMTSWHFNILKVKTWLFQERKELLKWNKKTLFLVSKKLFLDTQNKLAKK